jgi:spore coat polysaccharide biosynthesis protein SpsF (cytidylyltransferase family)
MKIAALITARLGSTRLSRKHLLPVAGKPILQYLVDAIRREFQSEIINGDFLVVLATSEKPENKDFLAALDNCDVYFGSDGNIPLRQFQAAKHFGASAVISVDGDDILCSTRAMRAVYTALAEGSAYAGTTGLPLGMNAMGYSATTLAQSLASLGEDVLLETGWGRVFDDIPKHTVTIDCPAPDNLRFTLDYNEDYVFFRTLLEMPEVASGEATDTRIVQIVQDRELDRITQPVVDTYWRNFRDNLAKEEGKNNR